MKYSITLSLFLGLSSASQHNRRLLQLDAEQGLDASAFQGEAIGRRLLQVQSRGQQWDNSVLRVVDAASYAQDVADALDDQVVNKETEERPQEKEIKPTKVIVQAPVSTAQAQKELKVHPRVQLNQIAAAEEAALESMVRTPDGAARHESADYELAQKQVEVQKTLDEELLAQIRKEKAQAKEQLAALDAQGQTGWGQDVDDMKKEWNMFSQTLSLGNREKAVELARQLAQRGHAQPALRADTKQRFARQFRFPEIAGNEFAAAQLQELDVAQADFNEDPTSEALLQRFIQAAQATSTSFTKQYGDFWTGPAADQIGK